MKAFSRFLLRIPVLCVGAMTLVLGLQGIATAQVSYKADKVPAVQAEPKTAGPAKPAVPAEPANDTLGGNKEAATANGPAAGSKSPAGEAHKGAGVKPAEKPQEEGMSVWQLIASGVAVLASFLSAVKFFVDLFSKPDSKKDKGEKGKDKPVMVEEQPGQPETKPQPLEVKRDKTEAVVVPSRDREPKAEHTPVQPPEPRQRRSDCGETEEKVPMVGIVMRFNSKKLGCRDISVKLSDVAARGCYTFGQSRDNDIVIKDTSISQHHGGFVTHGAKLYIVDYNSTNGIRINGESIRPQSPARVRHGDQLILGRVTITVL